VRDEIIKLTNEISPSQSVAHKWEIALEKMETTVDFSLLARSDRTFLLKIGERKFIRGKVSQSSFRSNKKLFTDFALEVHRILSYTDNPKNERPVISFVDDRIHWSSAKVQFVFENRTISHALGFIEGETSQDEFLNSLTVNCKRGREAVSVYCDVILPNQGKPPNKNQELATFGLTNNQTNVYVNDILQNCSMYHWWSSYEFCFTLRNALGLNYACLAKDVTNLYLLFRRVK